MNHVLDINYSVLAMAVAGPSVSHWNKEQKRFEKSLMISSFVFPNCLGLITINLFSWWFHDNFVNSFPWNIGHVSKRVKGTVWKNRFGKKIFKQCVKQLEIFTIICMKSSKNTKKIIILRMVRLTKNDFLTLYWLRPFWGKNYLQSPHVCWIQCDKITSKEGSRILIFFIQFNQCWLQQSIQPQLVLLLFGQILLDGRSGRKGLPNHFWDFPENLEDIVLVGFLAFQRKLFVRRSKIFLYHKFESGTMFQNWRRSCMNVFDGIQLYIAIFFTVRQEILKLEDFLLAKILYSHLMLQVEGDRLYHGTRDKLWFCLSVVIFWNHLW